MSRPTISSFENDELSGALRSAVKQAREQSAPVQAKEEALRKIARVVASQRGEMPRPRLNREKLIAALAAAAVVVLTGFIIFAYLNGHQGNLTVTKVNTGAPITTSAAHA